jgi:hypothetical protein
VLSWTSDLAQEVAARLGWAAVIGDTRFTYWVSRSGQLLSGEAPPDVLHLVGTPFETASGVRLPLSVGGSSTELRAPSHRGDRVRAEDIAALFAEVSVCVLQATPTETEMRTDTDREQAAYLRLFSADLFALGFPVVIAIPPLPASLSTAVMTRIARAVTAWDRQGSGGLLTAIAAARSDVMNLSSINAEAKLEAAADICLFAADAGA